MKNFIIENIIEPYKSAHYFSLDQFVSRSKFWIFLSYFSISFAIFAYTAPQPLPDWAAILFGIWTIYSLFAVFSLQFKRLNDQGASPLWLLLYIIPPVGIPALLLMMAFPSREK